MRPALLGLLLSPPLLRHQSLAVAAARRVPLPALFEYPSCPSGNRIGVPTGLPICSYSTMSSSASSRPDDDAAQAERVAAPPCDHASAAASKQGADTAGEAAGKEPVEAALPKLSAADFRTYNKMATSMEYFHDHFRQSWTLMYEACENNRRPAGMSLKQFIAVGLQLVSHLTAHHSIEEAHIFPVLARKMPEFQAGRNAAELLRQHREIHVGMDGLEAYLNRCRAGETEFDLRTLKQQMDTWGGILWKHLDQEVKTLGAENMRKYWTLDDMRRMPM